MKARVNVLSLMIFLSSSVFGQLKTVWMAQKKISLDNYGYCVSVGPEGNTYVSGAFTGSYRNPGPTEMGGFLTCFNGEGVIQWHKEFYDRYRAIRIFNAVDSKGKVIVAGAGLGIKRYTSTGNLIDSLHISKIGRIEGLCIDNKDNIIAAGFYVEDSVLGEYVVEPNTFLARYSSSGTKLWELPCYINGGINQDFDLAVDSFGNIYTTGGFGGSIHVSEDLELIAQGHYDGFVLKYNPEGKPQWAKRFGGDGISYEWPQAVAIGQNNEVYLTGTYFGVMQAEWYTSPQNRGTGELFLLKYDAQGNIQWLQSGGGTDLDKVREITIDANGNIFLCGSYDSPQTFLWEGQPVTVPEYDKGGLFVFQLDADGNPVSFTSGSHGHFRDLTCDNKGSLFLTGQYASPFEFCGKTLEGEGGMCLVKVSYDMNNKVGIQEEIYREDLFQIFPNPGKGDFYISLSDDLCPDATVQVYETSGRCVLSKPSIGCEDRNFQCTAPPGVYLVELRSGTKRQTRKVIVQ